VKSASAPINVGTTSVTDEASLIGVHPSPLVDMMHITLEQPLTDDAIVTLRDITGTLIAQSVMASGLHATTMAVHTTPGLYTLTIQGPAAVLRRTVVVR
jgi:hypothetical protein